MFCDYIFLRIKEDVVVKSKVKSTLLDQLQTLVSQPKDYYSILFKDDCLGGNNVCKKDDDCTKTCASNDKDYLFYKCDPITLRCNIKIDYEKFTLNEEKLCNNEYGVIPVLNFTNDDNSPAQLWKCLSLNKDVINENGVLQNGVCNNGIYKNNKSIFNSIDPNNCTCSNEDSLIVEKNTSSIPRCVKHTNLYHLGDIYNTN